MISYRSTQRCLFLCLGCKLQLLSRAHMSTILKQSLSSLGRAYRHIDLSIVTASFASQSFSSLNGRNKNVPKVRTSDQTGKRQEKSAHTANAKSKAAAHSIGRHTARYALLCSPQYYTQVAQSCGTTECTLRILWPLLLPPHPCCHIPPYATVFEIYTKGSSE